MQVHEVGLVHLDPKPEHFMRFGSGEIKLVDFGSATEINTTTRTPGHSRRYCAPELAAAIIAKVPLKVHVGRFHLGRWAL